MNHFLFIKKFSRDPHASAKLSKLTANKIWVALFPCTKAPVNEREIAVFTAYAIATSMCAPEWQ